MRQYGNVEIPQFRLHSGVRAWATNRGASCFVIARREASNNPEQSQAHSGLRHPRVRNDGGVLTTSRRLISVNVPSDPGQVVYFEHAFPCAAACGTANQGSSRNTQHHRGGPRSESWKSPGAKSHGPMQRNVAGEQPAAATCRLV